MEGHCQAFGGESGSKKRMALMGLSSLMLVAMVVAVTVSVSHNQATESPAKVPEIQTSNKAITQICQPTDYKEACVSSLSAAADKNTTDPKELVDIAFKVAVDKVKQALSESTLLKEASKDPRTKKVLEICGELMNYSIDDLEASLKRLGEFELSKVDDLVEDIKIWLSASMTYQETCLDGFEGIEGNASEKMRKALKVASELTSNVLSIVTEISSVLSSLDLSVLNRRLLSSFEPLEDVPERLQGVNRKLFSPFDPMAYNFPTWASGQRRRLLSSFEPLEDVPERLQGVNRKLFSPFDPMPYNFPTWASGERRRLLQAFVDSITPNVTVAKDGSGQYKTIQEAVATIPLKSNNTYVIYIKEGVYKEYVTIEKTMWNVTMIGDGPTKTIISGNKNKADGTETFNTSTVAVVGDGFMAKDIGFENTAGPEKHQAVALRVQSDRSIFYNCQMDGYQDTLYAHTKRQFYRDCTISGTVDFIFGNSATVLQNCKIVIRKPMMNQKNIVTAHGRKEDREPTGLVIHNCTITYEPALLPLKAKIPSYLARPWKVHSRTLFLQSQIDEIIDPEGYLPWLGEWGLDTCFYAEFDNRGPGAAKERRVKWKGIKNINKEEAKKFTPRMFIQGDNWIKSKGVPYKPSLLPVGSGAQ